MSVIAKLYVDGADFFGNGALIGFCATAENKLMAQYAPENEDVLFSKASPWGSARVQFDGMPNLEKQDKVYMIFVQDEPDIEGVIGWAKVRVASVTDFGGTSKQVEITNEHRYDQKYGAHELRGFTFRMGIDNPGASNQFTPGATGWWALIYRCADMPMDAALALAHQPRAEAAVSQESA